MPADFTDQDEIGAPPLCAFHREVIRNLTEKVHVGEQDATDAAAEFNRQCCNGRKP